MISNLLGLIKYPISKIVEIVSMLNNVPTRIPYCYKLFIL